MCFVIYKWSTIYFVLGCQIVMLHILKSLNIFTHIHKKNSCFLKIQEPRQSEGPATSTGDAVDPFHMLTKTEHQSSADCHFSACGGKPRSITEMLWCDADWWLQHETTHRALTCRCCGLLTESPKPLCQEVIHPWGLPVGTVPKLNPV